MQRLIPALFAIFIIVICIAVLVTGWEPYQPVTIPDNYSVLEESLLVQDSLAR